MVSISPRLRDSLDYDGCETTDPRFELGFRSLSINAGDYEEHDIHEDHRPFAGTPDPGAGKRRRQKRHSDLALDQAPPFKYYTVADGDAFRLAVLYPGTGKTPIECRLIWESSKHPRKDYVCLSYCWETIVRDAAILCDGHRFSVTQNLLKALHNLRRPTTNLLIWIDQICINQEDYDERGHQVSIMKQIFSQAKEVIVWLGEEDARSEKLIEYARKMRRGEDSLAPKNALARILTRRQLHHALEKLLERPWFQRTWVIPEIALARFTTVACGRHNISWDNLVRLIHDVQPALVPGFHKQTDLLGNARQRIAIITQIAASQRAGLLHTDITQLLILAKASRATDARDMVYAFYGLTLLTTFPHYNRPIETLYIDIAHMYVNSILWEDYYSSWHALSALQRTQQLMSILYSAGALHQHYKLPSWVPDWTHQWYLAPLWCQPTSNITTGTARDEWSTGIRSTFRAGGDTLDIFEVVDETHSMARLRVSAIICDTIANVSEATPTSTPASSMVKEVPTGDDADEIESPNARYGRTFFTTEAGLIGIATPGVEIGDVLAVLFGGDVPVILRPCPANEGEEKVYRLLCECFVRSRGIMSGDMVKSEECAKEDIVLM
ncbi:Heterokaryon incompatibility protein (HET) [Acrodontium crateriforme]|uniref:Heterokaryon incompatibility protein (HET) n=1 Tax=Acrodontium crateriforme TaxID=150365 RepID=A0AAQ3RD35_9PEZI|nr:Heterokaryon incompatibility protein (HET) [Acrodontium crateriforme]